MVSSSAPSRLVFPLLGIGADAKARQAPLSGLSSIWDFVQVRVSGFVSGGLCRFSGVKGIGTSGSGVFRGWGYRGRFSFGSNIRSIR